MSGLSDRGSAIVTGAARGIGQAVAWALAERGFQLALADLDTTDLKATQQGVEQRGAGCVSVACDISDLGAHAPLLAAATDAFGIPACLVNNAGISVLHRGDMLDVTPESFDRLIAVNLRGTFFLSQAVARLMLSESPDDRFRSIITVSSANSVAASPDRAEYCLAKSALSMMTSLFALRLAEADILVYEVRPGVIRTAMTSAAHNRYEARYARGDFTPINRWGTPSEVGCAVATLATGGLAFSTGEVINADGGLHIARL
jgi:NAD(P)-dependent dehydrogenase (short-subunit alcohol dehydrogenase family)